VAPAAVALICFCAGVAGEAVDCEKQLGARLKSDAHRAIVSTTIRLFIFMIIIVIILVIGLIFRLATAPHFRTWGVTPPPESAKSIEVVDHTDRLSLVICRLAVG
jgi:hypothetical protein